MGGVWLVGQKAFLCELAGLALGGAADGAVVHLRACQTVARRRVKTN